MTVEIIKRGSLTYQCDCRACRTVFRFGPEDVAPIGNYRFIRCPVCERDSSETEWTWPNEAKQ